jgi:hypothetical protein
MLSVHLTQQIKTRRRCLLAGCHFAVTKLKLPGEWAPEKPVIDIMAALQESLTKIKKLVGSESRPAATEPAATNRTKRAGQRQACR